MLNFVVLALAFIGSQQVIAEPNDIFIPGVPNPTVHKRVPNYIPGMPNPNTCPNFSIVPYHFPCRCNYDYCLDPYVESAAESLAANTSYLSLCEIQQLFLLLESVAPGIDINTQVSLVSMIVYGIDIIIANGGFIPVVPPFCDQYSGMDNEMYYYNDRIQYLMDKTLPRLPEDFKASIRDIIETQLQGIFEFNENELFFKICFFLRSVLGNMIDTTPILY